MTKTRKKYVIVSPSVEGNKVMNIPRVRRHAHIWKEEQFGLVCKGCGEKKTTHVNNLIPKNQN